MYSHNEGGGNSPHIMGNVEIPPKPHGTNQRLQAGAVIIVGLTGSGKSTFIASLTGEHYRVGNSLESYTEKAEAILYTPPNHNSICLIDTPGFDDTNRSDAEILREIAAFLRALMKLDMPLYGIVYLHRITDPRISGSTMKTLKILEKICGESAFPNVVLVSTMWDTLNRTSEGSDIGEAREGDLLREEFWGYMKRNGAKIMRLGQDYDARHIVEHLITERRPVLLQIQYEMQLYDDLLPLEKTAAGKYLEKDIRALRTQYERELAEIQADLNEAREEGDDDLLKEYTSQAEGHRDRILQAENNLAHLKGKAIQTNQLPNQQERVVASGDIETQYASKAQKSNKKYDKRQSKTTSSASNSDFPPGHHGMPQFKSPADVLNHEVSVILNTVRNPLQVSTEASKANPNETLGSESSARKGLLKGIHFRRGSHRLQEPGRPSHPVDSVDRPQGLSNNLQFSAAASGTGQGGYSSEGYGRNFQASPWSGEAERSGGQY